MVTHGSQVGNQESQPLGMAVPCNGTCGSHVGSREFQPLGTGSSLPGTKRKHSGTGPLIKTKRSVPVH